ncbi:hypothetical protein MYX84_03270 [Acidobacteria bacterium AH-259-O06]|nr:hypothetical protein [Acidobacteria bacterium AH-259-O06]
MYAAVGTSKLWGIEGIEELDSKLNLSLLAQSGHRNSLEETHVEVLRSQAIQYRSAGVAKLEQRSVGPAERWVCREASFVKPPVDASLDLHTLLTSSRLIQKFGGGKGSDH